MAIVQPVPRLAHERLAAFFLAGLGVVLATTVFGSIGGIVGGFDARIEYKALMRLLPLLWLAVLTVPTLRAGLPYRSHAADLPLACFAAVATLSAGLAGAHWGDVRNLLAAIGVGLLGRALFASPARRPLFLHLLGGTVLLVALRELAANPGLLLGVETMRYKVVTANANVLGFLFAMAAPIFLAEAMAAPSARRLVATLYLVASVLGTLASFSRTAALGLAVGSAIVVWHGQDRRRALACGAVALLAFLALQRPHEWTALRRPGDVDRLRIMRTSLSIALEHPLLGIGFGINNLEAHFPSRYEATYGTRLFRFHSANQIVDLLVGTGVVGTVFALWWIAWVVRDAWRRVREVAADAARLRAAGNLGALVAIVVMSFLEPPLYHGKLLPVLFLVIGYAQVATADPAGSGQLGEQDPRFFHRHGLA